MNKLFPLMLMHIFLVSSSWAACSWVGTTGTAASMSTADIADCVSDASSKTGDVTINLPAGTGTWSSQLTINMSTGFGNVTSLSIIGNGAIPAHGSAENSVVQLGATHGFYVTTSAGKKFRISNIKFTNGVVDGYIIDLFGSSRPSNGGGFRIDHNDFIVSNRSRRVYISARAYGVIDHNYSYGRGMFVSVGEGSLGANQSWIRGIAFGTSDAVYIEDNEIFATDYAWPNYMIGDCENGGRIVVRYNTMDNYYIGGHGTDSVKRSCLQYVGHNNIIRITNAIGQSADPRLFLRDGTHIMYNNTILDPGSQLWAPAIYLRNYRSLPTGFGCVTPWCNPCDSTAEKVCLGSLISPKICTTDSDCGGETGACQTADGATVGYPCRDQIGWTSTGGITTQMSARPSLFWANTFNGSYLAPNVPASNLNDEHIQNNRDYCHHATTMPSSCNSIATTYSPYTYPHPLAGGTDTAAPIVANTTPSTFECDAASPVDIPLTRSTDENATCRYAASTEEDWADMAEMATTGTTAHSQTLSLACGASYTYNVKCQDAATNESVNSASTFTILSATTDITAPVLSNPQPSGSVACGASSPVSKTISLTCTDGVGCTSVKCDTESGIDIDSMDVTLLQSGTTWSATVESLACDTTHTYYCKAEDTANNETESDTVLSFSLTAASTVTEAESGTLVAPVSQTADSTASGGYYIATATASSGTATYTYNIATAGYYQLVGNFHVADAGSDSWTFAIDNGAAQTWHLGGTYGTWVEKTFGVNQLFSTTGNKAVVFTGREVGAKFDWFKFVLLECSAGQRGYCISESACTNVGGVWSGGVCSDPTITPSGNQVILHGTGSGKLVYRSGGVGLKP